MLEKGNRANTLHGILLIALFSFAAFYIAEIPVVRRLSFSPLIVGIVLGMLYANSLRNRLPETWVPGIRFCTKQVLRWGIVLYGFRLTLAQVAAVGVPAVVVDLIVVTVTILGGVLLGRLLKIDRDTALMTSTGSAICGAAAVLGAEPVVKCEGYKTAIAVSTVVIFGTLSMFLYPVMYRTGMLNGMTDTEVAVYTGSTLHEVAHVAGAGNAMDPTDALGIAGTATITKMIRVMLLAPVLVIMGFVLAGWLEESDENRAYFRECLARRELPASAKAEREWARFAARNKILFAVPEVAGRRRSRFLRYVAAAAVVAAGVCAVWFWQRTPDVASEAGAGAEISAAQPLEYRTACGERLDIVLPDGSKVCMNSEATLTVDPGFGKATREIEFDGEAFFTISPDKNCPFIIHSANNNYTVLGTSFNLQSYARENFAVVTLHTGCLQAQARKDVIILDPLDTAIVFWIAASALSFILALFVSKKSHA